MRYLYLNRCPDCAGPIYFDPDPPPNIFCGDRTGCGWFHEIGKKPKGETNENDTDLETSGSDDQEATETAMEVKRKIPGSVEGVEAPKWGKI